MKQVWVLADDRAGNVNQLLGIAETLNLPFERKNIVYTKLVRLPNFLRDKTLIGITPESQKELTMPFPDIVLSAGRRSFPVARWIQKKSNGKTKIVQLMNPGIKGFHQTDLIVLPAHDNYTGNAKNVLIVTGTPHRINQKRLNTEKIYWEEKFKDYPHPRLSLIIGGATKNKPFTINHAQKLVNAVKNLKPASILVTTSRRTPSDVVSFLQKELQSPHTFFYTFGCKDENPYFGLIACADMIIVTGDSMSMCSECCATQVPVFIFAPDEMMSEKHKRFHQSLYAGGYALPINAPLQSVKGKFNPANQIVKRVLSLLNASEK
ncbi:MAG: nucleoside-diphosphate sugar epimerase [Alphaproteobacteria bacterium]|nr:nucleoside-diphosphate sugar epimerase [Alphaproteobacteria bacterium]